MESGRQSSLKDLHRSYPRKISLLLSIQATITTIVDRLEALGFVQRQRSVKDKRQFHLSVLPAGKAALVDAPDPLQTTFTERFVALPAWEQAMILAAAERLATLMDAQNIDTAPLLDSGLIDRSTPS